MAVTHECDYPPEVRGKPVITASALDQAADSATIDRLVANSIHEHRGIYTLDERLLSEVRPDLILTQELCDVCAVSYSEVQRAARILPGETPVVSLEPRTLGDILDTIMLVGRLTGREETAAGVVARLQARIDAVAARARGAATRPRVYCMEWIDPPFNTGHWIPEMVRVAGGGGGRARRSRGHAVRIRHRAGGARAGGRARSPRVAQLTRGSPQRRL